MYPSRGAGLISCPSEQVLDVCVVKIHPSWLDLLGPNPARPPAGASKLLLWLGACRKAAFACNEPRVNVVSPQEAAHQVRWPHVDRGKAGHARRRRTCTHRQRRLTTRRHSAYAAIQISCPGKTVHSHADINHYLYSTTHMLHSRTKQQRPSTNSCAPYLRCTI